MICMNFMMITFVIMLVSVSIIYKITNFFGFQLKFQSLLLCAICAFGVNFITLSISAYLTLSHLLLIFFTVLLSACLVIYYNERLTLETQSTAACPAVPTDNSSAAMAAELPTTSSQKTLPADPGKDAAVTVPGKVEENLIRQESIAPVVKAPVSAPVPAAKKSLPAKEATLITGEEPAPVVRKSLPPAVLTDTVATMVKNDMENDHLLKLTAALAKLNSLDAILDYAYDQKSRHNYSNALFAFRQALRRYETDEYAPFIIIEMGNIYKETGLYEEAIHTYASFMNLPAIAEDAAVKEKFTTTISYLRIVKCVLLKYNSGKIPFHSIPPSYMREIELTFENWYAKKHAS